MMWKWKRPAAFLLAATMIFTMPGVPASAVEAGASAVHTGLCKHHPKHTEDCGYTEGTEGAACEHEHNESCYPVLEGSVSGNTATPSEAEEAQPTNVPMSVASMTVPAVTSRPQRGRPAGIPASSAIPRTAGLFPACPGMLRRSVSAKPAVSRGRSIPTVRSALRKMLT